MIHIYLIIYIYTYTYETLVSRVFKQDHVLLEGIVQPLWKVSDLEFCNSPYLYMYICMIITIIQAGTELGCFFFFTIQLVCFSQSLVYNPYEPVRYAYA